MRRYTRILNFAVATEPRETCRLIAKHALSALNYRELALADVSPPIVVIVPDPMFFEPTYLAALQENSEGDLIKHCARMLGRQLLSAREFLSVLKEAHTPHDLDGLIADPSRFLINSEWPISPSKQYAQYANETLSKMRDEVNQGISLTVYAAFLGRMMQSNDVLFRSARYLGTPLVDAPTSWQYLLWKYEYDGESNGHPKEEVKDLVITKAIETEGRAEFGMLSGVPASALIELRQNGALAKLRDRIREGVSEIDMATPESVPKVAEEVVSTLDSAFEEHQKELRDLSCSHRRFFGFDVSRWIAVGGLSVAAAATQSVGLGIAAATIPALFGTKSLPEVKAEWNRLRSEKQELLRSPTAILFRHLGGKFGISSS